MVLFPANFESCLHNITLCLSHNSALQSIQIIFYHKSLNFLDSVPDYIGMNHINFPVSSEMIKLGITSTEIPNYSLICSSILFPENMSFSSSN